MKQVIISGGTQGLGRELGREFGQAGFHVTGFFRSNREAADLAKTEFSNLKISHEFICQDLTAETPILPDVTGEEMVLIHNACPSFSPTPFHLLSSRDFQNLYMGNVISAITLTQKYLRPLLSASRKTVIFILSTALEKPLPKGFSHYLVAKNGLLAMAESLEAEYGARGLSIQLAYPGFMKTALTENWNQSFRDDKSASSSEVAKQIWTAYDAGGRVHRSEK